MACSYQPPEEVSLKTAVATYGLLVRGDQVGREVDGPGKGTYFVQVDYTALHADAAVFGGQVMDLDALDGRVAEAFDHTQS
jgi:hypothetical protein